MEKKKQDIYLTVKISVVKASEDTDIVLMAMLATQKQPARLGNNEEEDEDSDDAYELNGKEIRDAYVHYNQVFNEESKQRGAKEELKDSERKDGKKGVAVEKMENVVSAFGDITGLKKKRITTSGGNNTAVASLEASLRAERDSNKIL